MVMCVWIRMDQKLLSVSSRGSKRTFDMDLVGILARDGRKCIAEGRDVVSNVIHVTEMEGGDLLPQQGVGPDGHGGAVREVAEIFRFWCGDAWFWCRGELA